MTRDVETYFLEGCGRCPLGGTPACKVHKWATGLNLLRSIILKTELQEESKWGVPCYTYNGMNVMTLSALKDHCVLGCFKGSLIDNSKGLLEKAGANSHIGRNIKFKNIDEIVANHKAIIEIINMAIEIERKGLKVEKRELIMDIPKELKEIFSTNEALKKAFYRLTPGKQRGFLIHFNQPKQSATRVSRIEKCAEKILRGEGLNDAYKKLES
jgi:uncharacterized protein YdeI (YjbR/CyaY-like superfamily)